MRLPKRRTLILVGLALLALLVLALSFRSPPTLVEAAPVERGPFQESVREEGRTRLPDRYAVSVPVSGYLHRIALEPGDEVKRGEPLFRLDPSPAEAADPRARARAELARADASVEQARTRAEAARAEAELAAKELERVRGLVERGHSPKEQLDRALARDRGARAELRSARFGVDVATHERDGARAVLNVAEGGQNPEPLTVDSPIDGVVLGRERQSAGRVQAGQTLLTLGDLAALQVEVDVLSADAVRLRPGQRVELERWGGDEPLPGRVRRVEPAGFTHVSALGVEEQRVWVIVDFVSGREHWQSLGDGYRVEARFILWEGEDVLQFPASALFREGDDWLTYVIEDGRAVRRSLEPGRRSGLMVEVRSGLTEGEQVILHPGEAMESGRRVSVR